MIHIFSELLVTLSASPATSLLMKATLVAAVGLLSTWFARRSRAAVRHALLASTFSVLLALPLVSLLATPVPIVVPVAKTDSNISPLFDYPSAPSSIDPAAEHFSAVTAKPGWSLLPLSTLLFYGWLIGAVLFMIPVVKALLHVRCLRRNGLPWQHGQAIAEDLMPGTRRRTEVLQHESLSGPITCGILKPLIVLPSDAQSWNKQNLDRALLHELEHVRRCDWPIHCLARIACAVYWFHPLVWIAWRQLALEAERSCDDAVLRSSDATAYADQLVGLARRRSGAQKSPALAMANRSDLSSRIRAVLNPRQQRGRAGTIIVALACATAALVIVTMSPLIIVAAKSHVALAPMTPVNDAAVLHGQPAAPTATPRFSSVSITPCKAREVQPGVANPSAGRLVLTCQWVASLIQLAYSNSGMVRHEDLLSAVTGLSPHHATLVGQRYNIDARANDEASLDLMEGPMLQALLDDRFKLRVHTESRNVPLYSLSVAKSGAKLQPSQKEGCRGGGAQRLYLPYSPSGPGSNCVNSLNPNLFDTFRRLDGQAIGLPAFCHLLQGLLRQPVIDRTGIAGKFDFHIVFAGDLTPAPLNQLYKPLREVLEKQLGLRIDPSNGPLEFFVIDQVEKPIVE